MTTQTDRPPERIETIADGVVAILITIMGLELKLPGEVFFQARADAVIAEFGPKLVVYALSFLVIAIMAAEPPDADVPAAYSRNSWPGPTHGKRMNRWRGDSGGNSATPPGAAKPPTAQRPRAGGSVPTV